MLEKLLNKILRRRDIARNGELYLRRYYLTPRSWRWKLFLHVIYKADDDLHPHGHPWFFVSLILWGGYIESIYERSTSTFRPALAKIKGYFCRRIGEISYKPVDAIHRIEALNTKKCWTLVLAGKSQKTWGFWTENGEIPWMVYQNKPNAQIPAEDDPRR